MHKPESAQENMMHKILRAFEIQITKPRQKARTSDYL